MFIEEKLLKEIVFKDVFNKDQEANDLIKSIIIENIPSAAVGYIMGVMINSNYEPLSIGDFVKFTVPSDWVSVKCELDYMIDLGLFQDGYIYGQIKKSKTYGSDFSPYHTQMVVEVYLHDEDGKVQLMEEELNTHELIKIDKSNIKYFKYGTDITSAPGKRMGDL